MSPRNSLPPFDAPEPIMRLAGAWLARRDRGLTAQETAEFEAWRGAAPSHARAVAQLERTLSTFDRLRQLAPEAATEPDPDAFAPPVRSPRWFYPSLAVAGLAAACAVLFWRPAASPAPSTWHYATAPASYERTMLQDGSTIELNGDTIVDVEFTAAQRNVKLSRGEAHFQVAKNPARPFVVQANGVAFRAVGTAFNVRLGAAEVEMLVTEGKVKVERASVSDTAPQTETPLLVAGHKIVVSAASFASPAITAVSTTEIEKAMAWQPQVAEFNKTPLAEVVAAFNRRNQRQIVIADPTLTELRIGGSFRVDQPDAFVRLLEKSFGVAAERADDTVTLRKAP